MKCFLNINHFLKKFSLEMAFPYVSEARLMGNRWENLRIWWRVFLMAEPWISPLLSFLDGKDCGIYALGVTSIKRNTNVWHQSFRISHVIRLSKLDFTLRSSDYKLSLFKSEKNLSLMFDWLIRLSSVYPI